MTKFRVMQEAIVRRYIEVEATNFEEATLKGNDVSNWNDEVKDVLQALYIEAEEVEV